MKYLFLAIYAVFMVGVALYTRKKSKNINDFMLGGRNIGPWLSAFAYGASYFSAVIFVGYAGRNGWEYGISSTWIGIGNAVLGSFIAWKVMAAPAREMTHRLDSSTMPDFFMKRYDSKLLKVVSAVIIFVFLLPYSASVYQGLGYMFETVFGIPFVYCMVAMAVLTALYLVVGGYLATAISDVVQGVIMIAGVIMMVFFLLRNIGGAGAALSALSEYAPGNANLLSAGTGNPLNLVWLVILTSLGVWGLPQMVHKFYAIKDAPSIKRGTVISTVFALIIGVGAYGSGAFGRVALSNQLPEAASLAASYDLVMPTVMISAMPEFLLGIIIVLMLSASMSTLAALVMTSASAIAVDLFKGFLTPKISQKSVMILMRALCFVFVAASLVISLTNTSGIVMLMSLSWGTVSGACLGPFLLGLKWRGATKAGAWAGLAGGFATSIGLTLILGMSKTPFIGCMAMFASIILTYSVSLFTKKMDGSQISRAFGS